MAETQCKSNRSGGGGGWSERHLARENRISGEGEVNKFIFAAASVLCWLITSAVDDNDDDDDVGGWVGTRAEKAGMNRKHLWREQNRRWREKRNSGSIGGA